MKNKKLLFSLLGVALVGVITTGCGKNNTNMSSDSNIITGSPTSPSNDPITGGITSGPLTTAPITDDIWNVTFDYNYENKFKTYLESRVKDGNQVEKPANPLRQGYDFVAWYDDPYCRQQYLWDFETPVRQSMTLYANWELNGDEIIDTDYIITYQTQLGATYVPVDGGNLIYTAEYGDMVRFKVNVESQGYTGTAIVTANGTVITPDEEGIYSYAVTENVTFEISGLTVISNSYKVYFENPKGWTDVYAYMWDSTGEIINSAWPGERMSYDGNVDMYYYEIESVNDCMYVNVIFNSGDDGEQTSDTTLNLSFDTGATLYSGNLNNLTISAFDPKSTTASIAWTESSDYTFLSLNEDEELPTSIEKGTTISFKIRIDKEDYTGNPRVLVNGEEITPTDDIYSFEVKKLINVVKVTNIMAVENVELYYTLPSWNPAAYNPKIYYWGTDENNDGAEFRNDISWDSGESAANDERGMMTKIEGNDYKYEIELQPGQTITGIIIVMYQDDGEIGNKKQSRNVDCNISSAGSYQLTFNEGWEQNEFGVWCFGAIISSKE